MVVSEQVGSPSSLELPVLDNEEVRSINGNASSLHSYWLIFIGSFSDIYN